MPNLVNRYCPSDQCRGGEGRQRGLALRELEQLPRSVRELVGNDGMKCGYCDAIYANEGQKASWDFLTPEGDGSP